MTSADIETVLTRSADLNEHRHDKLKDLFPEAFAEGRVDFDKLRATLGNIVDDRPDRYSFSWAGKKDAIRLLQTPTTATLVPDPDESINFQDTKNVFIEGENLEGLKLLYKAYFGRVKMIYIDPPYNTGNDFIYPDDYREPLEPYLRMTGQMDDSGNLLTTNPETSGRYHSAWLNMMYPRLFLARQLLRDDGVIFVSIDDNEVHNLRFLMNEIFGEENFQATIVWQKKYAISNDDTGIGDMHDYIVAYSKSGSFERGLFPRTEKQDERYTNPDNDPRGDWASDNYLSNKSKTERPTMFYPITHPLTGADVWPPEHAVWRYSREKHSELESDNRLYWGPDLNYDRPRLKRFLSEVRQGLVPSTWWPHEDAGHNDEAKKELARLMEDPDTFSTPKPVRLLKRLVRIGAYEEDAIVLDFFAGSAPLAEAVLNYNEDHGGRRQFILIQLPERTGKDNYKTISAIGAERIRRAVRSLSSDSEQRLALSQDENDLGFRLFRLAPSTFRAWSGIADAAADEYTTEMELFTDPIAAGASPSAVLWEVAIKEGYPLSSRIQRTQVGHNTVFRVRDDDTDQEFFICLDKQVPANLAHRLNLDEDDLFV